MDGVDSDDNDQEVIIIPIRDKTRDPSPGANGFRTENGVTVINIDKSNNASNANVVCEICSSSLKLMKYLERHMKSVHRDTCFYCSVCGVPKTTRKQLLNHQVSHKTAVRTIINSKYKIREKKSRCFSCYLAR